MIVTVGANQVLSGINTNRVKPLEVVEMFHRMRIFGGLFLFALLALTVNTTPALAAGMYVTPSSGTYGTVFTLVADGFKAGESVALVVIAPNNATLVAVTVNADGSGHIQYSAQIPSSFPIGKYTVGARGQSSGRQYSASFTVTGSGGSGNGGGGSPPSSTPGMTITPTSGGYDTVFVGKAGGFNPGEPVSFWAVAPDGSTVGPQTATADSTGAFQASAQIPTSYAPGKYTGYAKGQYSGRQFSVTFTLIGNPVPTNFPDWKGEYFNNQTLSGTPVLVRNDTAINFNWGLGSPGTGVPADHFSARWTRNQYFASGTYQFTATADDGIRVWVGSTPLIDEWQNQSATYTANITLSAGTYGLRVEYYENTGAAVAQVSWALVSSSTMNPWTGYYYNNINLSGSPVVVRQDADLNFNWGGNSPAAGVPGTDWSAKWDSSQLAPYSGNYTLTVTADDGVRVWIDGNLAINAWVDQTPTTYAVTFYAGAGWHSVHVEYYQNGGGSMLQVNFAEAQ